jgi:hypothetical protein
VRSFLESFQFGMNWPRKKDEQPILAYLELEQRAWGSESWLAMPFFKEKQD